MFLEKDLLRKAKFKPHLHKNVYKTHLFLGYFSSIFLRQANFKQNKIKPEFLFLYLLYLHINGILIDLVFIYKLKNSFRNIMTIDL